MQGESAQIVVTDPPYNCKIKGFVCNTNHKEFAMATGEMSNEQFAEFLNKSMKTLKNSLLRSVQPIISLTGGELTLCLQKTRKCIRN